MSIWTPAVRLTIRDDENKGRQVEMANPFVHVELNTTDVDKAKEFYSQLFDWELEDMAMGPSGTYTIIKVGDGTGGGLLKNPMPGVPSFWLAYVLVDDIDAATKKAESLGAKIVKNSIEVPDMGWLSIIADPTGAALGLWQTKS
jgi:predicted enzyme related to lactoylglutathione lyase